MKTKICSFFGHDNIYDTDLCDKLKLAINDLIENNNKIKFIFYKVHTEFEKQCFEAVLKAKSLHPDKVYIVFLCDITGKKFLISENLIDELIVVPFIYGHFRFINKKLDKWIINVSDFLISYFYKETHDPKETIYYLAVKKIPKIIDITDDETKLLINDSIDTFSDMEKLIFRRLDEGYSAEQIGAEIGKTAPTVRAQVYRSFRKICDKQVKRNYTKNKFKPRICGILESRNNAESDEELKNTINFLASSYGVTHFLMTSKCSLLQFSNIVESDIRLYDLKIKVIFKCSLDGKVTEGEYLGNEFKSFIPFGQNAPSEKILSLESSLNPTDDVINNSDYCICHETNIKNRCKNTIIINLDKKPLLRRILE